MSESTVKKEIMAQICSTYLHESADVETIVASDYFTYFETKYGHNKEELKDTFVHIETLLASCGSNVSAPQSCVVESDPRDVHEFYVAPRHLGFTAAHSVKGSSKLVHIMDVVDGFLRKP